ncbi:unnamed protein product [Haemonchus placei]|uniref:7TM_GPCR_Srx domain-containing protein n=1 Tax=Haemonchus placei TaxID=6290 RepID=A0A0N4WG34_HAEPC|nr:unnamed protein product [Haemonchus placei]
MAFPNQLLICSAIKVLIVVSFKITVLEYPSTYYCRGG